MEDTITVRASVSVILEFDVEVPCNTYYETERYDGESVGCIESEINEDGARDTIMDEAKRILGQCKNLNSYSIEDFEYEI